MGSNALNCPCALLVCILVLDLIAGGKFLDFLKRETRVLGNLFVVHPVMFVYLLLRGFT